MIYLHIYKCECLIVYIQNENSRLFLCLRSVKWLKPASEKRRQNDDCSIFNPVLQNQQHCSFTSRYSQNSLEHGSFLLQFLLVKH